MTTYTKTVGSSGRDYPNLNAWLQASVGTATSGDTWIGQTFNDSEFVNNGIGATSGNVVAGVEYILTTGSGQSFADNAGVRSNPLRYDVTKGVGVNNSGVSTLTTDSTAITKFTFSKLQFRNTFPADWIAINSPAVYEFDQCIFDSDNRSVRNDGTTAAVVLKQCIIITRGADYGIVNGGSSSINLYGCTMVCPSNNQTSNACYGSAYNWSNCAIFGYPTGTLAGTFTAGGNTTDLTGSTGLAGGIGYNSTQFVNTTNAAGDWRLPPTGSALAGAGVADSTNNPIDITGLSRKTPPDSGAWEIAAAGSPPAMRLPLLGVGAIAWAGQKIGDNKVIRRRRFLTARW